MPFCHLSSGQGFKMVGCGRDETEKSMNRLGGLGLGRPYLLHWWDQTCGSTQRVQKLSLRKKTSGWKSLIPPHHNKAWEGIPTDLARATRLHLQPWLVGASFLTLTPVAFAFVDRKTTKLKILCNSLSEMSGHPEARHLYLSPNWSPSQCYTLNNTPVKERKHR